VHFLVIPKDRDGLTRLSKAEERHKALLGHLLYVAQLVAKQGARCRRCVCVWAWHVWARAPHGCCAELVRTAPRGTRWWREWATLARTAIALPPPLLLQRTCCLASGSWSTTVPTDVSVCWACRPAVHGPADHTPPHSRACASNLRTAPAEA
jgi:hypothetical protein